MSYDDVIRVADLKTRGERAARKALLSAKASAPYYHELLVAHCCLPRT